MTHQGPLNPAPPRCPECGTHHEPAYPHELTERYREAFAARHGRSPVAADTYAHCEGLMFFAARAAHQERCAERAPK